MSKPDAALLARATAARKLIHAGEITPHDGLYYVIFPPLLLREDPPEGFNYADEFVDPMRPPHGTESYYTRGGCRCVYCTVATSDARRDRKRRAAAKTAA